MVELRPRKANDKAKEKRKEEVGAVDKTYIEKDQDPRASVQILDAKANLRKDTGNIFLLLFLYFLQGIPLGLAGSLPLILSSHHVSYADQGLFSFALWPFSFKLLW